VSRDRDKLERVAQRVGHHLDRCRDDPRHASAKASIMAWTSSPSGYRIGQVASASTYSATLARHSSAVPRR
jgi:hypothetical protein